MWDRITDSSILFKKECHNNNNFYTNTVFINRLYFYYINKGYNNIILSQIINIVISNFIIWFIIFLINVIDYKKIIGVEDYIFIDDVLNWGNYFNLNYFMWIMVVIFIIFTITKILNLIENLIKYYAIRLYYRNNLNILDQELDSLEWCDIVDKITKSVNTNLNICNINTVITTKDNYIMALLDNNIIKIGHLTHLMEWNIIYCILLQILSKYKSNITNNHHLYQDKPKLIKEIKLLTQTISLVNFIFMPFVLTILLFYNIFNYGEQFYNNPVLLSSRIFTKKALWKFKYYNELNHEFDKRITKINKLSFQYTKSFPNNVVNLIFKLLLFVCSSIFIVLIILSIINDKILIYILITKNQSVLWFIGILGSLIAFLRNNNTIYNPKIIMTEICDHIYIKKDFVKHSYKHESFNEFTKLYQYKLIYLIKDIMYTILVPFQLWVISYDLNKIVSFINNNTIEHNELQFICKFADFNSMVNIISNECNDNIDKNEYNDENGVNDNDSNDSNDITNDERCKNIKSVLSYKYFKENYPHWENYMHMKLYNIDQSLRINII